jgi:hypothetical protein
MTTEHSVERFASWCYLFAVDNFSLRIDCRCSMYLVIIDEDGRHMTDSCRRWNYKNKQGKCWQYIRSNVVDDWININCFFFTDQSRLTIHLQIKTNDRIKIITKLWYNRAEVYHRYHTFEAKTDISIASFIDWFGQNLYSVKNIIW